MDPADTHQGFSSRDAAIARHEQSIRIAHDNIALLARSVDTLVQHLGQSGSSGAPGSSCVRDPDPFDGNLDKCRGFVFQCGLVFSQCARLFPSDNFKINYIISLLRGKALAWAQANASARLDSLSLAEFLTRFKRVFDRPNHAGCAGDRLLTLRQGGRSVAEYAVEFGTLATESEWNEPALLCVFRRGLNDSVRDLLVTGARPGGLSEMIDRAIELDNYQRERQRERQQERVRSTLPQPRFFSPHGEELPALPAGARSADEEPMQRGGTRLSPSERRHRLASGSCLYCGQTGHFIASCSIRPRRPSSSAGVGVLVSLASTCPKSSRLILQGVFLWGDSSLPVPLMVDSGADDSFIDEALAKQAGLPVVQLPEPRTIQDLDGRTLARCTHRTTLLTLLTSGNHREQIQLFLIPSSAAPVVLGSPWLATHNPQIDWTTGTITAWSVACHSRCLRSALPPSSLDLTSPSVAVDLATVPEVYHDLGEVFSKQAGSLPSSAPTL